jgi:hypothetical protein
MSFNDLILLLLVAVGAFAAGFQVGRFKTLSERGQTRGGAHDDEEDGRTSAGPELDGPIVHSAPARPRGAPPPASAGDDDEPATRADAGGTPRTVPMRRSTKPPPAAAGLMDKGSGKTGNGPK